MKSAKPFYENRSKIYDCHIWWHPNFPHHLHKELEFVYSTEGYMDAVIAGKEYHIGPGDALVIYPNQIHSFESEGEVGLLMVLADMEQIGGFQKEFLHYEPVSAMFNRKQLSRYGQDLLDILVEMGRNKDEKRSWQLDKGVWTALLADIQANIPMKKREKISDLRTAQKLFQYINENITNELRAKEVANKLGISPYYLSHIFADQLKISFPAYVARQRLILACNLLLSTDKTITEISYECGFSNMRAFHRSFQKRYECTPSEWRHAALEGENQQILHQLWNADKIISEEKNNEETSV